MAQNYYFFNSVAGDERTYQAQDFAEYFGTVLTSGIVSVSGQMGLKVKVAGGNMDILVEPGKAIIKGHLYENTTDEPLTLTLPGATQGRVDRIVLRLDLSSESRHIKVFVKEGTAGAPPTLQRDNTVYELSLARITLSANTSSVATANITDERLDSNVAGIVNSLVSVSTERFDAEWDAYLATLAGQAPVMSVNGIEPGLGGNVEIDVDTSEIEAKIGNLPTLQTTNKANLVSAINEVFQSGSNVKSDMVAALLAVDPTLPITTNSSWTQIEAATSQIETGPKYASGTAIDSSTDQLVVTGLSFQPYLVVAYVANGSSNKVTFFAVNKTANNNVEGYLGTDGSNYFSSAPPQPQNGFRIYQTPVSDVAYNWEAFG